MSNYPAGAEHDPRAPWNQVDPDPLYKVVTEELWTADDESLGFQVMLLEVNEEGDLIDELDLWYNFEEDANDHYLEEVDEYKTGTDYEEARRFFDAQVEFYTND